MERTLAVMLLHFATLRTVVHSPWRLNSHGSDRVRENSVRGDFVLDRVREIMTFAVFLGLRLIYL